MHDACYMMKLYEKHYEMDDFAKKVVNRTILGAVLTKKQWSFSIGYLRKYGEPIKSWPDRITLQTTEPPVCNPDDHPKMFEDD